MPDPYEVELDIFSGMPNPTWRLSETESDAFERTLGALLRVRAREMPGNLGYRGFLVRSIGDTSVRLIEIGRGVVRIMEGANAVYLADQNRALERWLCDGARPHLPADLFQMVTREVP